MQQAARAWNHPSDPTRDFIKAYMAAPESYKDSTAEWRKDVFERFDALMQIVGQWPDKPLREVNEKYIPRPKTHMRITPVP